MARLVGSGNTADVVEVDEGKVAKVFHEWVEPSYVHYEFRKSQIVAETGLNVPHVYEKRTINGKEAIIFDQVEGVPLDWVLGKKPMTALIHIEMMSKVHAEVHSHHGLDLPPLKETLVRKIEGVKELSVEERKKVMDHLFKLPVGDTLCHGDFHPGNIILSEKGPMIIDWSDATIGNKHADLVRTILILNYGGFPDTISAASFHIKTMVRRLISFYYIYYYKKLQDVDTEAYKNWILPVAAARLTENIPDVEKKRLLSIVRSFM